MSQDQSEAYLPVAAENWVLAAHPFPEQKLAATKLAAALAVQHSDRWLDDFLHEPASNEGNKQLLEAISKNRLGAADYALKAAIRAARYFEKAGNNAGVARSRFELLYALDRTSKASACRRTGMLILDDAGFRAYNWIEVQTLIEISSCEIMANLRDRSVATDQEALTRAVNSHYEALYLRALAMKANLEMSEGRRDMTWSEDQEGLGVFWQGVYPDERAFQFYHDLQFSSEMEGREYLGLLLQKEALSMIEGRGRYDFEATAHLRLAEAEARLGYKADAEEDLIATQSLINRLPVSSAARTLYEAYCQIGLARLAIQSKRKEQALGNLERAFPVVSAADNASLRLVYFEALSELDRALAKSAEEASALKEIIDLARVQLEHTASASDRWHMRRAYERAQRRLLEIALLKPHDSAKIFTEWHWWKTIEQTGSPRLQHGGLSGAWGEQHLKKLDSKVFVSFVVLPHSVVAWVFSNHVLQEHILLVEESSLQQEVARFYSLCSDPSSEIEKVNASGARLYEMLIVPLELTTNSDNAVYINADSFLSFVPWSALRTREGRYWGLMQNVVVHTGFGESTKERTGTIRSNRFVVATPGAVTAGNEELIPLPNAMDEAAYISELYPEARFLKAGNVNPSRILSQLATADAFHFAGHALDRQDGGELVAEPGDGLPQLSASTLRHSAMPFLQLVVLSACATAAPGWDVDQSPDGLVRAFTAKGVPVVIASRWDVDSSSTAMLMRGFYSSLKSGKSPMRALKDTKQDLAQGTQYKHPYYWAGFQAFTGQ